MSIPRDRFLLDLYRLTQLVAPTEFLAAALELLKKSLPFDTALWGTFARTPAGPLEHAGHLHGLPPQMLEEYRKVRHLDVLNQRLSARPGHTVNLSLEAAAKSAHPDVIAHARRWCMEHTLGTVLAEPELNLFTVISLYRRNPKQPFRESERRIKQAVMPHLVAAWHLNALRFLAAPTPAGRVLPRARARIDRSGVAHNADPSLVDLLRRELPGWTGPIVPDFLLELVEGAAEYKGRAIVASLLHSLGDGTFVISVRPRTAIDTLSPRELEVARAFAAGRSHKEIAEGLGTSPATVRSQIQSIYTKLGVGGKVELLRELDRAS